MLGVRLTSQVEEKLNQYARATGRNKSAIVRDWIIERLERDSVDGELRRAAKILSVHDRADDYVESDMDD